MLRHLTRSFEVRVHTHTHALSQAPTHTSTAYSTLYTVNFVHCRSSKPIQSTLYFQVWPNNKCAAQPYKQLYFHTSC